ncbi:MAG TPA: carboxypeptidase-like regulatory domain-containing protein [Anaerolineae bacterium]|nr:carboxypeptidase-like regulatory domain-containing protein [Anaerolineae bacterium]
MKRNQKLLLTPARGCLGFVLVVVVSLTVTACGKRDGVVEGTVRGVDPNTAQVQVVIYDLTRSDDVPGMDVFHKGVIVQKALVDANGHFAFTLPAEEYVLQVWLDGYEVVDRMIEVESGRTTTLDLEVAPPSS